MTSAGYVTLPTFLDIVISPFSIGSLKHSKVLLSNSKSSSKNKIPLWAKVTSPTLKSLPPPMRDTLVAVWCGFLKGLSIFPLVLFKSPETLYILVVSNISFLFNSGNKDLTPLASIVLPDPGGPCNITLWFPAAAIIIALFALSWPQISLKELSSFNAQISFSLL